MNTVVLVLSLTALVVAAYFVGRVIATLLKIALGLVVIYFLWAYFPYKNLSVCRPNATLALPTLVTQTLCK
jgi:hypothetical protein